MRIAAIVIIASTLLACSAQSTCDHYGHKDFNPMPEKALEACAKVCEDDDYLPGCERASDWYLARGDVDRARALGRKACALRGDESCLQDYLIDLSLRRAAYNEELAPIRERLWACRNDPGPCEAGCERGEIDACVQLADMYAHGLGVTANPERAHELYARACERHDDAHYCWSTMAIYVNPESCAVPDNRPPCDDELEVCPGPPKPLEGCGDVSPAHGLTPAEHLRICNGQRACDEVLERSCLLEVEACERACEVGEDAARCRQLGLMHERGLGLPRNPAKAQQYRARACELGDGHSCDELTKDTRKLKARPLPAAPVEPAHGSLEEVR